MVQATRCNWLEMTSGDKKSNGELGCKAGLINPEGGNTTARTPWHLHHSPKQKMLSRCPSFPPSADHKQLWRDKPHMRFAGINYFIINVIYSTEHIIWPTWNVRLGTVMSLWIQISIITEAETLWVTERKLSHVEWTKHWKTRKILSR